MSAVARYSLFDPETITVDGVEYTEDQVRGFMIERHRLATENVALKRRLDRADLHLRRRTAALVRLIAKKETVPRQGW